MNESASEDVGYREPSGRAHPVGAGSARAQVSARSAHSPRLQETVNRLRNLSERTVALTDNVRTAMDTLTGGEPEAETGGKDRLAEVPPGIVGDIEEAISNLESHVHRLERQFSRFEQTGLVVA